MNRRYPVVFSLLLSFGAALLFSCTPASNSNSNNSIAPTNNAAKPTAAVVAKITEVKPANEEEAKSLATRAKEVAATEVKDNKAATSDASVAEACYRWPTPWRHGDCTLAGPASPGGETGPLFCLRSNGTGSFRSRGLSTDDDDEYIVRFEALDAGGGILFNVPPKIGPFVGWWKLEIPNPGIWYDFNQDFTFPGDKFGSVRSVRGFAGC